MNKRPYKAYLFNFVYFSIDTIIIALSGGYFQNCTLFSSKEIISYSLKNRIFIEVRNKEKISDF